ncbi:MAG: regulatory protein GemA, partial [Bacteroidota bacterium]
LDDDLYREILRQEAQAESSAALTYRQFDRVMARMRKLGFRRRRQVRPAEPGALITREQQEKLQALYAALGWTASNRQQGFNRRQIARPWPQTRQEANKVIEGLKKILARERREGCADG